MNRRLICALALALAGPSSAQEPAPANLCFRGRAADRCRWFLLTELGADWRPGAPSKAYWAMMPLELGLMRNTGSRAAIGGVVFMAVEDNARTGIGIRYRRWLGESFSLEQRAGVYLAGLAEGSRVHRGSPSLQTRLTIEDFIGLTARLDLLRHDGDRLCTTSGCISDPPVTSPRFYLGAEAGSWLGTGLIIVGTALTLLVAASYYGGT